MSVLYNNIQMLCESHGITGYRLCKDIGMSPNVMTELRMGRREGVTTKNLDKIAKYFNVTTDYLLGLEDGQKEKTTVIADDGLSARKRVIVDAILKMSPEEFEHYEFLIKKQFQ